MSVVNFFESPVTLKTWIKRFLCAILNVSKYLFRSDLKLWSIWFVFQFTSCTFTRIFILELCFLNSLKSYFARTKILSIRIYNFPRISLLWPHNLLVYYKWCCSCVYSYFHTYPMDTLQEIYFFCKLIPIHLDVFRPTVERTEN